MKVGDILNMRNWDHCTPNATFTFSVGRDRQRTAVMIYLGDEPRDGSAPLDLDAAMNRLGWYRTPAGENNAG